MNRETPGFLTMGLRSMLGAAICVTIGSSAMAQIVPGAVALPASITGTRVLSTDTAYQIVNVVKVESGGLLSIPPGTLIYGNGVGTASYLMIERGGKIHAQGTAERPIIFTSPKGQGGKASGDWGGIVILGNGTINAAGGIDTVDGTSGIYGGNDDADSSGVLSYVRIEYAGGEIAPGVELNGLTFAGTGNRTKIDHIQVSYSRDDSYEWLGGRANGTHILSFAPVDDDFSTTLGFQGRLQFLAGLRDSTKSDPGISNGIESENDAAGSSNAPLTQPIIANLTLAGPFRSDTQATGQFGSGGYLRRNTRIGLFNSVIVGWQEGLRLGGSGIGTLPPACPQPVDLKLGNTAIGGQTVVWGVDSVDPIDAVFWFICGSNPNPGNHPLVGLRKATQTDLRDPDLRPVAGTPAASGTNFGDALLAPGNGFTFATTSYKGAFDPNIGRELQWDIRWSNYDPHRTIYLKHRTGWNLVGLANTPASTHKNAIYREAISNAFRFSGGYIGDTTLQPGVGYWIQLGNAATVEQRGEAISLPRTITVEPGWNLISTGASVPAQTASVEAAGTTILSSFFGFDNGYRAVTTLEPGRAYWVQVAGSGTVTFK